jgi:hypothetical protein
MRSARPWVGVVVTLAAVSCLLVQSIAAQEKPPDASAKAAAKAKADETAWEKLIYVPFKQLKSVLDNEATTVFMPYSQFLNLWQGEAIGPRDPSKPPVNAVITSATYVGKIEKDLARIDADFTIRVLDKPWAAIPLKFGDVAVGKLTSADGQALLQGTGEGTYSLLLPTVGEHKVHLELVARVRTSPEGKNFELECPATGITSFDLTVPAADQTVEVTPNLLVTPVEGGGGDVKTTRVQANLGATRKITARWHPRTSTAPAMELLTSVDNTQDVRVADGLVHTHATLAFKVLRGSLDQVRIAVPAKHRILDVTAPGMKSWKSADEAGNQVITLDLLAGVTGSVAVEIHTERPATAEPFDVIGLDESGAATGIHSLGPVRENGLLVLSQAADLQLSIEQQQGLVRVESGEVSERLRRPESLYYKFYSPKVRLLVLAKPVEPRLLVNHRTQLVFGDDELTTTSTVQYTVERAGVFELRFKLPDGLKVDRVDCEQMKEFQVTEPAGENKESLLIVSLREKTQGAIAVTVTGHISFGSVAADKQQLKLPLLEPVGATREQGEVLVFAPESLEIITDEKGLQAAQPWRPDPNSVPQLANVRLASAWSFTRRPVEIPVTTYRKPTRLSAAVATSIVVKQDLAEVVSQLVYSVQYAGIDTFRFTVPEAVADSVQIESLDVPLKQKSKADAAENGWVTWTVITQREVTGNLPLRVKYDLKIDRKEKETGFAVSVQPVRVLDTPGKSGDAPAIKLSSITGEVAVQKDRALSISAKSSKGDTGDDFEAIDVRELTRLPQDGYLAYRYFRQPEKFDQPFALELTATKHDIQPVVETVMSHALVEVVLTNDKVVTYRCRYRIKSSERQRIALHLPESNEPPLGVMVAGKEVELEAHTGATPHPGWKSFFLNVARPTRSDEPFEVLMVFRIPHSVVPVGNRGGGQLELKLPRFGDGEIGTASAVAVQQLRAAVWVPKEVSLIGEPPHFTLDQTTRLHLVSGADASVTNTQQLTNWFGAEPGGLFTFTQAGHAYQYSNLGGADSIDVAYWRPNFQAWIISGLLVVLAFVLRNTSWENRLALLLITAFAATLYAMTALDLVLHVIAAARYGLIVMLAYWFIHALGRTRPAMPAPPVGTGTASATPAASLAPMSPVSPPPAASEDKKEGDKPKEGQP